MLAQPSIWTPSDPQVRKVLADPRRVIPFLGAGMTIASGLPDTEKLAVALQESQLGRGVDFEGKFGLSHTFNALGSVHPQEAVQEECKRFLLQKSEGARTPPTYPFLVQIPSRWIITLSYDLLLEQAAAEAGRSFRSVTWKDEETVAQLRAGYTDSLDKTDELIIFHLHGSLHDPSSIVADRGTYRGVSQDGVVRDLLVALMSGHRTCWMGCRIDESYLVALLQELSVGSATHCFISDQEAIQAVRDAGRMEVSTRQHGMAFDGFPTGAWHHLTEFCEWLVTKQAVSSAPLTADPSSYPAAEFTSSRATVEYVRSDWGPQWTLKALRHLGEQHPDELAALEEALSDVPVESLIETAPTWLMHGSWELWVAVARFAEEHGNWPLASRAWEYAAVRPDADRTRCFVSAAIDAQTGEDHARSNELTARARAINPVHPRLLLADAHDIDDPADALVALTALFDEPGDVGTLARCHAVISSLRTDDLDGAEAHLRAAESRGSDLLQVRLSRINFIVHRGRTRFADGERADARELQAAREDALSIRDQLIEQRRFSETCRLIMLAADATAVQGDMAGASELLRSALPEEIDAPDGRIVLADAALRAQDHPVALELLAPLDHENRAVDAMRGQAELRSDDENVRLAARERMLHLIITAEDEHATERAANAVMMTAEEFPDLPFPEAAADWFIARGETRGALVARALWLYRAGQPEEARELLRAHEPARWAVEVGFQLGLYDDDLDRIVELASGALSASHDPQLRLVCARKFSDAGQPERAREIGMALAVDESAPTWVRAEAFMLIAYLLVERDGDHQEALRWLTQWAQAVPEDRRHVWGRIQSLLRLGAHEAAATLLLDSGLAIERRSEAQLAGRVYLAMDDREAGLRRLADLRDELPEPDDDIDRLAWFGLLRGGDGLPSDLAVRLQPPPEFQIPGQQVSIDEMLVILRERHEEIGDVVDEIMRGEGAVTKLAQVSGRSLTEVWSELLVKPAGFGTPEWDAADVADAQHALTRGAVADPTALVGLALLPDGVRDMALRKLIAPVRIVQSTLDDVNTSAAFDANTGKSVHYDPATDAPLQLIESDESLAARRDALRAVRGLALAQRVEPDVRADQPTRLDRMFEELDEHSPTAVRALVGSLVVAERTGRPFYSDDRVARQVARQLGVRTFASASLLRVLAETNTITDGQYIEAITTLRAAGYRGVRAANHEIAAHIKTWDTGELQRLLYDRLLWDASFVGQCLLTLEMLHRAVRADPQLLPSRVEEVLTWTTDAASAHAPMNTLGRGPQAKAIAELLTTLMLIATSRHIRDGMAAMYDGIERFARSRTPLYSGEVLADALRWMNDLGMPLNVVAFVQLPFREQLRVLDLGFDDRASRSLSKHTWFAAVAQLPAVRRRPVRLRHAYPDNV